MLKWRPWQEPRLTYPRPATDLGHFSAKTLSGIALWNKCARHTKNCCTEFSSTALISNFDSLVFKQLDLLGMGVRRNFPGGGNSTFCLSFSVCQGCNANGRTQQRKCPVFRQHLHTVLSLQENFTVSKCFSEHEFFKTELAEFEMDNKLRKFLEQVQNLMKIRKIYAIHVASARDEISLRRWSGGSAHLRTFRGALVAGDALCWQQCFFFTHASLHMV